MELTHEMHIDPVLCKKKPCEPPKPQCKEDEKKSKKKKKENKGGNCQKKPQCGKSKCGNKPKKKCTTIDSNKSWVTLADPQSLQELPTLFNHHTMSNIFKSKPKNKRIGSGHIRKFRYGRDGVEKTKSLRNRFPVISPSSPIGFLLKEKKKCPDSDTEKCQKNDDDDPCGLKKKGKTKECPKDLLVKKRRKPAKPRKKTQGANTPLVISTSDLNKPSTSSQRYT